jgi:hypothetical protein
MWNAGGWKDQSAASDARTHPEAPADTTHTIWFGVRCDVQASSYEEAYTAAREWLAQALKGALPKEARDASTAAGILVSEPLDLVEAAVRTLQRLGQEKDAARTVSNPAASGHECQ